MNLGEWLGAIPNAIGKFMYDAGIPDPMADQYAKKQQFDLMKKKNEQIIKRYKMDNDVNETLAGIAPKMDKNGKMVFLPGVMGQFQQDVFVNGVKPYEAIRKYGAQLAAVGGIAPDKMQMAALSPEQFGMSAEIKGGLRQSADQWAKHRLNVAKFQNESLRNNAKDTMTLIAKINEEGGDSVRVGQLMNNMAMALASAGFGKEQIQAAMVPIQEVASGRKDIRLADQLRKTENIIAQGWAKVNIAAQKAAQAGKGKNKDITLSKRSLAEEAEIKKYQQAYQSKPPKREDFYTQLEYEKAAEEHAAKVSEAEEWLRSKDVSDSARLKRFKDHEDFYRRMKENKYTDDEIDEMIRQNITARSLRGE